MIHKDRWSLHCIHNIEPGKPIPCLPQANTRHWPNVYLMLGQRRRGWANFNWTLGYISRTACNQSNLHEIGQIDSRWWLHLLQDKISLYEQAQRLKNQRLFLIVDNQLERHVGPESQTLVEHVKTPRAKDCYVEAWLFILSPTYNQR